MSIVFFDCLYSLVSVHSMLALVDKTDSDIGAMVTYSLKICAIIGAELSIESEFGIGTTFTVIFGK